jgi:capsular polysaccharide biosynthesis protein
LISEPVIFSTAVIPSQGIILGKLIAREMLSLYDQIKLALSPNPSRSKSEKVYFSRSRLEHKLRRALGERHLEERLRSDGFRIVHPQLLSLQEQVELAAATRTIVGPEGSALHLSIFRDLDGAHTVSLGPLSPQFNQFSIDEVRGARNTHVHAHYPLHLRIPRMPDLPTLKLSGYRDFLVPALAHRLILRAVTSP